MTGTIRKVLTGVHEGSESTGLRCSVLGRIGEKEGTALPGALAKLLEPAPTPTPAPAPAAPPSR